MKKDGGKMYSKSSGSSNSGRSGCSSSSGGGGGGRTGGSDIAFDVQWVMAANVNAKIGRTSSS